MLNCSTGTNRFFATMGIASGQVLTLSATGPTAGYSLIAFLQQGASGNQGVTLGPSGAWQYPSTVPIFQASVTGPVGSTVGLTDAIGLVYNPNNNKLEVMSAVNAFPSTTGSSVTGPPGATGATGPAGPQYAWGTPTVASGTTMVTLNCSTGTNRFFATMGMPSGKVLTLQATGPTAGYQFSIFLEQGASGNQGVTFGPTGAFSIPTGLNVALSPTGPRGALRGSVDELACEYNPIMGQFMVTDVKKAFTP